MTVLFPFDPDRTLGAIQKPQVEPNISLGSDAQVEPSSQGVLLQTLVKKKN